MNLFPLVTFDRVELDLANRLLVEWGHDKGACRRPFRVEAFGLSVGGGLVSVALSASTVRPTCGGFDRKEVVELARLCSAPDSGWATRVCLRLWREVAPAEWKRTQWPVVACVSYSDSTRHTGNVYRFDGWERVVDVRGGKSGPNGGHQPSKNYPPKTVWAYRLSVAASEAVA